MKKTVPGLLSICIVLMISVMSLNPYRALARNLSKGPVIGVYDSRIVVFAYSRSELFSMHQEAFRKESDSAQKANDTIKLKELSLRAVSYQHLLHQMVFGPGSTAAIVALVKDHLAEVAKTTGVSIIMSKFELSYADPKLQTIDITGEIVKLFNPKENIDEMSREIAKNDPVPLEDLTIEAELFDMYCARYGEK